MNDEWKLQVISRKGNGSGQHMTGLEGCEVGLFDDTDVFVKGVEI